MSAARKVHPDDDDHVSCWDCADLGTLRFVDSDGDVHREWCDCATGQRKKAARLAEQRAWKAPTEAHETTFMPGGRLS